MAGSPAAGVGGMGTGLMGDSMTLFPSDFGDFDTTLFGTAENGLDFESNFGWFGDDGMAGMGGMLDAK